MTYFIDLRASDKGGIPVANIDAVFVRSDEQRNPTSATSLLPDLKNAIQGRNVLLGTHGFHVDRKDGIDNLHHWNEWIGADPNCYFVGVLWPGDSKWIPFLDYPVEGDEAIKSGQLLAKYLIANFSGAASLSFTSHSLGARVMLETIKNLPGPAGPPKLVSLTLMAGAIDDTCLVNEYAQAAKNISRVSVLASKEDDVLKLAFPAGNVASGIVSRGDPYWHGAIGRYGPNPPNQPSGLDGSPILPNSWDFGHFSYVNCKDPITGPQAEAGPFDRPVNIPAEGASLPVPPDNTNPAANIENLRQAWAAAFVLSRFS